MERHTCKQCQHFVQHYVRLGDNYIPCGIGHCTLVQLKVRRTDQKACDRIKK